MSPEMYSLVLISTNTVRSFPDVSLKHHEKYHIRKDIWCIRMTEDSINRMVNKGVYGADDMKFQTAEKLEEAARKLRSADISTHGEDLKHIMNDIEAQVYQFKKEAGIKYDEMEGCFHTKMEPVETIITNHPIPAVLVAIGVGVLAGMLIRR
jgi:ElaB/YqjD/DUF883 family membrane-anchored ribosome-binding protein